MHAADLRAFWFEKQGLGGMAGASPSQVLERAGWARSVGGSNPYLTLFSRAGISRERADLAARDLQLHELPSARGCTYVVPASDFALALKVGQGTGEPQDLSMAKKFLGVTDQEVDRLCDAICRALDEGQKDPAALRTALGDAVRNLGDEGKKRGLTTTLSLGLGKLQNEGEIRRVPINGRLDQQRYGYVRWPDSPLRNFGLSREEAATELGRRYFHWIGPASLANFQWFSGLGVKAAKDALAPLTLSSVPGTELLILSEELDLLLGYRAPGEPRYALVSGLDSLMLLRRDVPSLLEAEDMQKEMATTKGRQSIGGSADVSNNAIVDRGRIVGLWEFDSFSQEIVWSSFVGRPRELVAAVGATQTFIREQLGDARSFSLDSPESRKPVIQALRTMG